MIPATGLTTILDCPKATRAITFHLSGILSVRSTSLPSRIFLLILPTFLANKKIAIAKQATKTMLPIITVFLFSPVYPLAFRSFRKQRNERSA